MGIADGPTEVHKQTLAKQVMRDYAPDNDLFPSYHLPKVRERAQEKYADLLPEIEAGIAERMGRRRSRRSKQDDGAE
jgi:acyl-CoA dehydrogenase